MLANSPRWEPACSPPAQHPKESSTTEVSTIVELNVGDQVFTTTTDALRKVPGSRLAEMLSSPASACKDAEGHFFIDHPSTFFHPILDYLHSGQVPKQHLPEVCREAQIYAIQPLVKLLEDMPQIFGKQVSQKQFLLQMPSYSKNLELLLRLARAEAVRRRASQVVVCVVSSEEQATWCADPIYYLASKKISVVKFGPCKLGCDRKDLRQCLEIDIKAWGYQVSYDTYNDVSFKQLYPHLYQQYFCYKLRTPSVCSPSRGGDPPMGCLLWVLGAHEIKKYHQKKK
ncbi:BTB/POZ domain-containing protein KCTD14-like [Fukomys damarensis]|uniref:BTB/POZ domain-containing protein KCTD14 n=1 Tax=Fukomys damarensis TaxID=885580 RepID=A0A091CT85_FUKDA|nr:BTB/POZ domain-containing protein KCTD14-like [Fukomys damarensis]KFO21612.1 BTB/POZ domain-containing protein KCTD14 [Fukomys damarensis]